MRLVEEAAIVLYELMQGEEDAFLNGLYRQALDRQPSEVELLHGRSQLHAGKSRLEVTAEVMQSQEAVTLYQKASLSDQPGSPPGLVRYMGQLYAKEGAEFLRTLYAGFLGKSPDLAACRHYAERLREPNGKTLVIHDMLVSSECARILALPVRPVDGLRHIHIGFFIGYDFPVMYEGEGIGHFIRRITEGFLARYEEVVIQVAIQPVNLERTQAYLQELMARNPDRLLIQPYQQVEELNTLLPVDVWIVPHIMLEHATALQAPTILCLHDLVHLHFPDLYYPVMQEICQKVDAIAGRITHHAEAVLFQSEFTRTHEGRTFLALPEEKTHTIPFAAPSEEYRSIGFREEDDFRARYDLPGPYLLFPSRIRLHKNHERLIEAFLLFSQSDLGRESRLSLVLTDSPDGKPNHPRIQEILDACPDEEARKSVLFLSRVPTEDMPSLYKYACGTIVPSLFEGAIPFPILESLLANTLVSASAIEMTQEVVKDTDLLLGFNPYDVTDIQIAIERLWENRSNLELLQQQKKALGSFLHRTWMDVAEDYMAVIHKLIFNKGLSNRARDSIVVTATPAAESAPAGKVRKKSMRLRKKKRLKAKRSKLTLQKKRNAKGKLARLPPRTRRGERRLAGNRIKRRSGMRRQKAA